MSSKVEETPPVARHKIGLSQAWHVRESDGDAPSTWVRSFGRPTGLEETDRVLLVVEGATVAAELTLNANPLARPERATTRRAWDVTSLLRQRNELLLVPDRGVQPPGAGGEPPRRADRRPLWPPLGEVALEIVAADDDAIA